MKDYIADLGIAAQLEQTSSRGQKLFERLGGRPTLDRVHKIFYEKLYAHMHMMITEELFEVRHVLLRESLAESKINEPEFSEWLAVDAAFKRILIKKSVVDCKKRFNTDDIVNHLKAG